jgi:hypothetical protein
MTKLIFSSALLSLSLLTMAPSFGQTSAAQKQPTQDSAGGAGTACNPNAKPTEPSCGQFKWHTQNLQPSNAVTPDPTLKSK